MAWSPLSARNLQRISVLLLLGALAFIGFYLKKAHAPLAHTVAMGNVASVQTNMLEFEDTFEGDLSGIAQQETVREAYQKLLALGKKIHTTPSPTLAALFPPASQQKWIKEVLVPWYSKVFPEDPQQVRAAQRAVTLFCQRCARVPVSQLIFAHQHQKALARQVPPRLGDITTIKMGHVDKALRMYGFQRYSLLHDIPLAATDFVVDGRVDAQALVQQWVRTIQPALQQVAPPLLPLHRMYLHRPSLRDNGALSLLMTMLFDLLLLTHLAQEDLFGAAAQVRKVFYHSPLGNPLQKLNRLAHLLLSSNAEVICLQEADRQLPATLVEGHGYFSMDKEYRSDLSNAARILLKHKAFQAKNSASLVFSPRHLKDYWRRVGRLDPRWSQRTVQEQAHLFQVVQQHLLGPSKAIAMVRTRDRAGTPFLIVAAHADDHGHSSIALLYALRALIQEQPDANKLRVILAHDANTMQPHKGRYFGKLSLQRYLQQAKRLKFQPTWSPREAQPTVNKCRSYLQTQPRKAHIRSQRRGDFILTYRLPVQEKKLIAPGPNLQENPTDHAILLARVGG